MDKVIFGLVGKVASGKGTVSKYLKENHGAQTFRFSDPLRETLSQYDLEISRDNMQNISTILRQNFGENILAKAIAKKVKTSNTKIIIIDGVRRFTDIENLTEIPGFYLINVDADQKIRYQRYIERNENIGDAEMSFEKFSKIEEAEADKQIPEVAKKAKFKIENNDTKEKLYERIDDILKECTK